MPYEVRKIFVLCTYERNNAAFDDSATLVVSQLLVSHHCPPPPGNCIGKGNILV